MSKPCPRCYGTGYLEDTSKFRLKREFAAITLRDMAKTLGVSAAYLSDMERGRRNFTPSMSEKFKNRLYGKTKTARPARRRARH